jgi:predicted AAA+ superfamily ATPase
MRNALMKNFEYELDRRRDKGVLYESIVFLELQKNTLPNTSLHFWRTKQKNEVDFIKLVNRQPIPIEVKSNLKELSLPPGLKCFLDKYPSARKAYVVNAALTGKIRYKKTQVEFLLWSDADRI